MEDFLPIIIGIIWLVVSVIGKKKKQPQQSAPQARQQDATPSPTPASEPKTGFEDLLEEFFGTDTRKQAPYSPQPRPAEQPIYPVEQPTYEDGYYGTSPEPVSLETMESDHYSTYKEVKGMFSVDDTYVFSGESKQETMDDVLKAYMEKDEISRKEAEAVYAESEENQNSFFGNFHFDVRQAIIYSEIINKKY